METTPYYGDVVRKLFIVSGLVILITLPFLKTLVQGRLFYSLIFILILAFVAGITSPKYKQTILVDMCVSVIGFGLFAYQGIAIFSGFLTLFFITNLVLAILFLFAFYWSVKTAREIKFSRNERKSATYMNAAISANENTPPPAKKELSEEERRRKRFLGAED